MITDIEMKQEPGDEAETSSTYNVKNENIEDENAYTYDLQNENIKSEEDDPVVKEIEVFISKSLSNNIFILQVKILKIKLILNLSCFL